MTRKRVQLPTLCRTTHPCRKLSWSDIHIMHTDFFPSTAVLSIPAGGRLAIRVFHFLPEIFTLFSFFPFLVSLLLDIWIFFREY